jgi:transcriptional regulator with XRE-family HTH domain
MGERGRNTLGARIRELRTAQSLSHEELADRADLHRTYIGAVERGERNVSLDNILAIAKALRVSASELLRGVE